MLKRVAGLFIAVMLANCQYAYAVLPNIFATQPTGNVPASLLDTNFTFLESQGVQAFTTTGSSNAYIATPADAWATGYSNYVGRALTVIPNFTNSDASTINVSGLGTASIYKNSSGVATALIAGDIASGIPAILICDGTNFLLTNPTSTSTSSGALILLKTINAAAQSSVIFDNTVITNAYNKYVIEFDSLYGSANSALYLTISTDNGSTYKNSGYIATGQTQPQTSTTITGADLTAQAQIDLGFGVGQLSAVGANYGISGTLKFSGPNNGNNDWFVYDETIMTTSNGSFNDVITRCSGWGTSSGAVNNIKLAPSTGTFTGNFHLYGIAGQ